MKNFLSKKAPEPVGYYPHAKKVGNLLFLSGVGPRVPGTKDIPGVNLNKNGGVDNYDIEKRLKAQQKLHKLGTKSSRTKIKNRCLRSSRAKGVYRKFKISRIELRELALKGAIPGYSKKSW